MRRFGTSRHAMSSWVAVALLTGCGALPLGSAQRTEMSGATHGRSWMAREAKKLDKLVYVSEWPHGPVSVYDYRTMHIVGKLEGFNEPTGQCVDAAGDVWISQADGQSVTEYAHGGSRPIKTLSTSGRAFGCSVSPNGDLAVANFDVGSAPGSIQVFKKASGPPEQYSCSGYGYYYSPGYDGKGNLYVEVLANLQGFNFGVCRLPSGGNALEPVKINVTIKSAGSVMWDGRYITLAELNYHGSYTTAIYRAKESSSGNLTVVGTTVLVDSFGRPAGGQQPFILGKRNTPDNAQQSGVVVGQSDSLLTYWRYPRGAKPTKTFPSGFLQVDDPFGESVSIGR